jgi:L-lactate dehydrogenase
MRIEFCVNERVKDSAIIVVTASVETGGQIFTSSLQLVDKNTSMFRELIPMLAANNTNAVLVIVTNPVDVMTYAACNNPDFHRIR